MPDKLDKQRKHKMHLEGRQIFLRPLHVEDATEIYQSWLNDPDVNQFLESRFKHWDKNDLVTFINQMNQSETDYLFGICNQIDKVHIGNIKLGDLDINHGFATISLLIGDKEVWGKGVATESIRLVCEFAFGHLGLNKVVAGCYENNIGSKIAFEKVGFWIEGRLKHHYLYQGNYIDKLMLGLLRDTWQERKPDSN